MPQYIVPQFIEHEPKVVGPLTFRQFLYLAVSGGFILFFYFSLAKENFFFFLLLSFTSLAIGSALAFLKVNGRSLPIFIGNFFKFNLSQKIYTWKKKYF